MCGCEIYQNKEGVVNKSENKSRFILKRTADILVLKKKNSHPLPINHPRGSLITALFPFVLEKMLDFFIFYACFA